ncbi:acyl carrier protein [Puniceibacterium sediminis]|uniref:Acyl carrier protein n=1 Tax=Puniceibacterium sediminis TaxID=1608407 RepID=A0A238YV52_9RHOB|nr:acyl carrier protein [Puniceibacterium sediminis]SNR74514.1 Acyl carrier protein [Puniceibacterium sediminis]
MPDTIPFLDDVRALIAAELSGTDIAELAPDTKLHTLGIDSLTAVNLVVALSAQTGVDLEDFIDDLETPDSIAGLCDIVARFHSATV